MRLKRISYKEFEGRDQEWILNGLTLGKSNLLVGRNATGKTRTLNVISGLANMLTRRQTMFGSADYTALFDNAGKEVLYTLKIVDGSVVREALVIDGTAKLDRCEGGEGTIFAEKAGYSMTFQAPTTELAAVARRDSIQHPFLQPLHDWGATVRHYHFGGHFGKDRFFVFVPSGTSQVAPEIDDYDETQIAVLFRNAVKEFGESNFKQALLRDLENIDYPARDVGIGPPHSFRGMPSEAVGLWIQEKGLKSRTDQDTMSQGMFRVLSLLILANYLVLAKKAGCILVDDIGEGLDFGRSCQLIDLLREKAEQSAIQLVVSTNDKFVMNRVPLEEWSVLQRRGGEVRVLNVANSRELFEEFKFTGLSNFSFLEMDFASGAPEAVAHE